MNRNLIIWLVVWITNVGVVLPAIASDICDSGSKTGDVCICKLSELHPTQASVGMMEVQIRTEKLKKEVGGRSEQDFLSYMREHNRIEPIVIGPGGAFYITDRHHLARALYNLGETRTYCKVLANLSGVQPEAFWRHMEDSNEVYLKDYPGNVITPRDLPTSIGDLPFRSLAGAVREFCGFNSYNTGVPDGNYLEFKWADYLRTHWAQTRIDVDDIDAHFDWATQAALHLAIQKEAAALPGYTGKASCQ